VAEHANPRRIEIVQAKWHLLGQFGDDLQRSLPLTLAFAATADRPTAVLTGPAAVTGSRAWPIRQSRPAGTCGMVRVSLQNHPLTASAALVWSADLPRPLQQLLFETADSLTAPASPRAAELVSLTTG
jgi:hypothetical protein